MPQISIIENFADGTVLTQAQLAQAFQSVQDFLNNTRLDEENIIPGSLTGASIEDLSIDNTKLAPSTILLSKLAQEITDKLVPSGAVSAYAGTVIPSGWFYCDGTALSRSVYPALFGAIGILHGNGDGSTTFNVPDYRGYFLRGQNDSSGIDPEAAGRTAPAVGGATADQVGSVQQQEIGPHNHVINIFDPGHAHSYNRPQYVEETHNGGGGARFNQGDTTSVNGTGISANSNNNGGTESRPVNKYVRYIIKL